MVKNDLELFSYTPIEIKSWYNFVYFWFCVHFLVISNPFHSHGLSGTYGYSMELSMF